MGKVKKAMSLLCVCVATLKVYMMMIVNPAQTAISVQLSRHRARRHSPARHTALIKIPTLFYMEYSTANQHRPTPLHLTARALNHT